MKVKMLTIAGVVVFLLLATGYSYYVPETHDVKIIEAADRKKAGAGADQLRIRTVEVNEDGTLNADNTLVFRNEDALAYFKWDSEDLQTKAGLWAVKDANYEGAPTIRVRSYGWRIKLLSVFPNAISAWELK